MTTLRPLAPLFPPELQKLPSSAPNGPNRESTAIRSLVALTSLVAILFGASCRKADPPKAGLNGNVVAVVAGAEITVPTMRAELERRFRDGNAHLTNQQKLSVLESLIQTEAVYAKAKAAGFDRTPQMEARIKDLIVAQYKEAQFTQPNPAVTDQEIEQYYRANRTRYATPPAVRGAVILLTSPANATKEKQEAFRAHAESILAEAKAAVGGQMFTEVVLRYSEDQASRYHGGETTWMSRRTTGADSQLAVALDALEKPGDFAPLIPTARGFYIAKLLEKKQAGFRPIAEVRDTIRYQLARYKTEQAAADFQASIKQGLDIRINRALLESLTLPAVEQKPPALPGTQTAQLRQ